MKRQLTELKGSTDEEVAPHIATDVLINTDTQLLSMNVKNEDTNSMLASSLPQLTSKKRMKAKLKLFHDELLQHAKNKQLTQACKHLSTIF